jgi:hypothetical protein
VDRSPCCEKFSPSIDDIKVNRDYKRRRLPSRQKIRCWTSVGMSPGVENLVRCGFVELWTTRAIHRSSGLKRSACYVVCRPCALHIIEEWIIAQPSKDSESPILAFDTYGVTRIAVNIVGVADPALNGVRHIEPAHDQRGCGRLAESLSAIDVEYVLQPIGKLMSDDVHHQIQPPSVR